MNVVDVKVDGNLNMSDQKKYKPNCIKQDVCQYYQASRGMMMEAFKAHRVEEGRKWMLDQRELCEYCPHYHS